MKKHLPTFAVVAIECALTGVVCADISVPAAIDGVSPTGAGTAANPLTYTFAGALNLGADNILNPLTLANGNVFLTGITDLTYGAGGAFDFSGAGLQPSLEISGSGLLAIRSIATNSTTTVNNQGTAGTVKLSGDSGITVAGGINARAVGSNNEAGAITLTSTNGVISVGGTISAVSDRTPAAVSITGVSISVADISTHLGGTSNTGGGGAVTLTGTTGDVKVSGAISTYGGGGSGGNVNISVANGGVTVTGLIDTHVYATTGSGRNGGTITLSAGKGNINVGGVITAKTTVGTMGALTLNASGDVILLDAFTRSNLGTVLLGAGWLGASNYSGSGVVLMNGSITGAINAAETKGDIYYNRVATAAPTGTATFRPMVSYGASGWDASPTSSDAGLVKTGTTLTAAGLDVTRLFVLGRLAGSSADADVKIYNGATLAPGSSGGTLTITGNLAMDRDSIYSFEFDTASDKVTVSGALAFDTAWALELTNLGDALPTGKYNLFEAASVSNYVAPTLKLLGDWGGLTAGDFSVAQEGNNVVLTVIPEPTAAILLGLGGLAGLLRRRVRA